MPISVNAVIRLSHIVPAYLAARMPSGMAMRTPRIKLENESDTDAHMRLKNSFHILLPVTIDVPRSPWIRPFIYFPYLQSIGLSRS